MKKRVLGLAIAACMAVGMFAGCGAKDVAENPEKLVFTYVTAPLNVPSIVEKEKDIFENTFNFKDEILDKLMALEVENHKKEIEHELDELDKKRIRAVCEPSLKDDETTWLEFYNQQILKLRKELSDLYK